MKGVFSRNLVENVANGRLDNYTLNELRVDECDVIYVLFTYPGQDHLPVEPLLRIVSQGEYNPLKNMCQCGWREDINADSIAMLTTILKTHYIFANIPWRKEKHSAHGFAQSFKAMTFIANDNIITQGEDGDNFYVIESGYVDIVKSGKKIVTLGPLDAFGELALVGKCRRNASCIAISRVRCWALGVKEFLHLVEMNDVGNSKTAAAIRRQLLESGADVSHISGGRWSKLKAAGRMRGALVAARRRRQSSAHITSPTTSKSIEEQEQEGKNKEDDSSGSCSSSPKSSPLPPRRLVTHGSLITTGRRDSNIEQADTKRKRRINRRGSVA